ncbi:hypothetical protein Lesp02_03090 [Lentzea sp. NBRC 105346]|uniref:hypothetical protein n=1 Tax=Lentzea sp. NBRC 105346 TaxID=3032205 RepID=UPI0024A2E664|nr:hypothetical protein [Lentzea sp. NBRC 105346]GLZ28119.1 hypothetical protein Lesp02_03090 [Lentzea sp. NBRC 105346]
MSAFGDNTVLLRDVRRHSIAPIPVGPAHAVHNPVGRVDVILRRFTEVDSGTPSGRTSGGAAPPACHRWS